MNLGKGKIDRLVHLVCTLLIDGGSASPSTPTGLTQLAKQDRGNRTPLFSTAEKACTLAQFALVGADQKIDQAPGLFFSGGPWCHRRRIHGREFTSRRQRSRQGHARGTDDFGRLGAAERPDGVGFSQMAHGGCAIRKDLEAGCHLVRDIKLLQNFRNMNAGRGGRGIRNKDRVGGKKRVAQCSGIADRYHRVANAHGNRSLDQADVRYRSADDKLLLRQGCDHCRRQHHDVGGRAAAQFVGHGAHRAEFSLDVEAGQRLELGCEACDQTLGRAAAENVQHGHEFNSIAAIRLSRVIGRLRTRTPSASNTALAIAAVTGPWAASPAPTGSLSGRWMISTCTSGTSLKRRIGYDVHVLLVMRWRSKRTRSFNTQLVAWIAPPSI